MKSKKNMKRKHNYSKIGCVAWAVKNLWQLDRRFVLFVVASIPVAVVMPLAGSYFSRELIDHIGAGTPFPELAALVLVFVLVFILLDQTKCYLDSKCEGRNYYPTIVHQTKAAAIENYYTDYENTEKQDFRELAGYMWNDACTGNCSLEYIWKDLRDALIHLAGIVTYASLLLVLNPLILIIVAIVSLGSYFTTRWQAVYYEKNKQKWEKEIRKKGYLGALSEDFSRAKDIKLYALEGWLDGMMRDYQAYILMWNKRCNLRGLWAAVLAGLMALVQNGVAYLV
ncbi:MAG: hypothetical protein K2K19_07435, partial [Acetatifactor sp.]|nr:hypothetical protein [Acetatifactor sp.]